MNRRAIRNVLTLGICGILLSPLLATSHLTPASAESVIAQLGEDIVGASAEDRSGWSVSLSLDGTRVAVGSQLHNPAGHVRVFDWHGANWVQVGVDIVGSNNNLGDLFGTSVSLSADGSRVAVGAIQSTTGPGFVQVFEYDPTSEQWDPLGSPADMVGTATDDEFGYSVSLSADGNRVAVGAPAEDTLLSNEGVVRVYDWNGTSEWVQAGPDIEGEDRFDRSGWSVSLSSDGARVAIGARQNDDGGADSGHVRVYELSGTTWTQIGGDINGEAANDRSGVSVSLSADGSRVAIGANANDGNGTDSGHVRVYQYENSAWRKLGNDIDGEGVGDNFGWSVSLSSDGSRFAAGGFLNDGAANNAGHARVFDWNGESWVQAGLDIDGEQSDDWAGYSIALSARGNNVAVAAPLNDGNGNNSGHVRVFSITEVPRSDNSSQRDGQAGEPGVFLTVIGDEGRLARGTDIVFGSYAIQPGSPVLVTIQPDGATTRQVLSSVRANGGGHVEQTVSLPALAPGRYTITLSAQGVSRQLLVLGNRIEVNSAGRFASLTPESLQPTIR